MGVYYICLEFSFTLQASMVSDHFHFLTTVQEGGRVSWLPIHHKATTHTRTHYISHQAAYIRGTH